MQTLRMLAGFCCNDTSFFTSVLFIPASYSYCYHLIHMLSHKPTEDI